VLRVILNLVDPYKAHCLYVEASKLYFKIPTNRFEFANYAHKLSIPDGGYVNAFLAATLTRVMRAAMPIPVVASASVLHSAAVVGSVVGDVGPL